MADFNSAVFSPPDTKFGNPDGVPSQLFSGIGSGGTTQVTYYRMKARDADCAVLTYRVWTASGHPDYAGAQYTGPKCGGSPLADVTVSSSFTV